MKEREERGGYLDSLSRFGSHLGLDRVERLLAKLGRPQDRLPAVHVAGTNGKGSTSAMIASILAAAGYRVGLYTSPHLCSYTERFLINGQEISPRELDELLARIRPVVEELARQPGMEHPTEFEILTAAAFLYFAGAKVDLAVLEVGLGGRLDATNVISPLVAVITHIALDHRDVLGETLPEIAREKAGIIKAGVPVVSSRQEPEAAAVIEAACQEQGSTLSLVGRDIKVEKIRLAAGGISCDLSGENWRYPDLHIPLLGRHQAENGATALGAVELLRQHGFTIGEGDVRQGLARLRWPGRMEVIPGKPLFLLDVAHNPDGVRVLRAAMGSHFPGRRVVMVFGALADKDVAAMAAQLTPLADVVIATRPESPRALEPEAAAALFREQVPTVLVEGEIPAALARAREYAGPGDIILVCGSFYLVGSARAYILNGLDAQKCLKYPSGYGEKN
ncbi:MAG: folylpolyglutamate synthase/dihydrofolate synthase family protein [bacterium]